MGDGNDLWVIATGMVVVVDVVLVYVNVFRAGVCSDFDFPDSLGG